MSSFSSFPSKYWAWQNNSMFNIQILDLGSLGLKSHSVTSSATFSQLFKTLMSLFLSEKNKDHNNNNSNYIPSIMVIIQ